MGVEMSIGKLADAAGVNIETIRYQRRGLLGEPLKPLGGHRRYAPGHARRVRFIKRAQALGFTLDEVVALLTLDAGRGCAETRALANRKRMLIERKMADLAGHAHRAGRTGAPMRCRHGPYTVSDHRRANSGLAPLTGCRNTSHGSYRGGQADR